MTKMNLKNVLFLILRIVFLTFISALTALPFIWMVCSALKPSAEVMESASFLPSQIEWSNITSVLTESPIPSYIFNTMWISLLIVALQVVTSAMLAYALVFMEFKGKNKIFMIVMATYMLPVAATYIPSYIILSHMKLLNTLAILAKW